MKTKQIEIIRVALKLISEKGLENLTVRNLATKMGFKDPAIYYHFKSKEELLEMIVEYGFHIRSNELRNELDSLLGEPKSPLDELERFVKITIKLFLELPGLAVIEFGFLGYDLDNTPKQLLLNNIQLGKRVLFKNFENAIDHGLIREGIDKNIIYDYFQSIFFIPLYQWTLKRFDDDLEKIIMEKFRGFKQLFYIKK